MKTLLLFGAIALSITSFAQETYVPDDNFEAFLENFSMGNGVPNDDYVTTANINGVTNLNINNQSISDLTGIQDFTALVYFTCDNNQLTSVDVTQNSLLDTLSCNDNQLTSLDLSLNLALTDLRCNNNLFTSIDVSQNIALINLECIFNQLTSLDVTQNIELTDLWCYENQLTSLDLSQNTALAGLICRDNSLMCLNVKNGNNSNVIFFNASDNPNLTCIEVDDVFWSNTNWTYIDAQTSFSMSCANSCALGIEEVSNTPKQLIKIVDLMGRETPYKPNTVLIYVFDDGSTEKVFKMED